MHHAVVNLYRLSLRKINGYGGPGLSLPIGNILPDLPSALSRPVSGKGGGGASFGGSWAKAIPVNTKVKLITSSSKIPILLMVL